MLHTKYAAIIKQAQQDLLNQGKLFPQAKLEEFYRTFRERFSPEQLAQMDGIALLEYMHDHSNRDGLAYWLEFKNDDEFPAIFGSIAGGSALKFIVFRRKETGNWETRDESNYPTPITDEQAIEIARTNRRQLLAGAELLKNFPENATPQDYQKLQEDMDRVAPDVSRLGWGHKYFSLLYPDILDDYHNPDYQRFHIIKMLQEPPIGDGRYVCAWWFVQAAHELDMPLNHLTTIFNYVHGRPYQYWRIGTSDADTKTSYWEQMRDGNFVAIGWSKLGDLSQFAGRREVEQHFKDTLKNDYTNPSTLTTKAREVQRFTNLANGDIAVAMSGQTVLGIGRVTGGYEYAAGEPFPHRRPVEWLSLEEWKLPEPEGYLTTCHRLQKSTHNLIEIEQRMLDAPTIVNVPDEPTVTAKVSLPPLNPLERQIRDILERKGQVILYGPPGTGKTYWALRAVRELAARKMFQKTFDTLNENEKSRIVGATAKYVRMCSFHPAYGYEDFLEGYRPEVINDQMAFQKRNGIFKAICADALNEPEANFYLIIDEINRGDIPRIFGELITLIEVDKRGQSILLPLSGEAFQVPENVYIIGTMNTADRSIALLDTALRRRFGFVEFMPDSRLLANAYVERIPLDLWLEELNKRIVEHVGRDARNLQIGHAYLMSNGKPITDFATFSRVLREDIIPLLEEYCYEDYMMLERILGNGLVDSRTQRINYELFGSNQQDALIQALLVPEIITSGRAVNPQVVEDEAADDEIEAENE